MQYTDAPLQYRHPWAPKFVLIRGLSSFQGHIYMKLGLGQVSWLERCPNFNGVHEEGFCCNVWANQSGANCLETDIRFCKITRRRSVVPGRGLSPERQPWWKMLTILLQQLLQKPPGLLIPAFLFAVLTQGKACQKWSHAMTCLDVGQICRRVALSFCTAVNQLLNSRNVAKSS